MKDILNLKLMRVHFIKNLTLKSAYLFSSVIFLMVFGSCKKEPLPSNFDLLTSKVWGETSNDITNPELYTCIFEPGGNYYTFYKGYETHSGSWKLYNDVNLKIDTWNATIKKLTENILEYSAPMDFYNLLTINVTYHLQALTDTKVTTIGVSELSSTSARLHGFLRTIDPSNTTFEYGISETDIETTTSSFTGPANRNIDVKITNLEPGTVYKYRIKLVNSTGNHYGNTYTFRTFNVIPLTDTDNNTYNTTTIGNQVWMTENLKTTKFSDGSAIPLVSDGGEWCELETPAFCWYENDPVNYGANGALYNWYTVYSGKLCPDGWHVPLSNEWDALTQYLGFNAGLMLMEGHFNINYDREWLEASNETGFSASQSFARADDGYFFPSGSNLWTSTENNAQEAWYTIVYSNSATKYFRNKKSGLPVRCLKD